MAERGRPGSAGYIYSHGWIPNEGGGAEDKRSKADQKAKPFAKPKVTFSREFLTRGGKGTITENKGKGAASKPRRDNNLNPNNPGSSPPSPQQATQRSNFLMSMSDVELNQRVLQLNMIANDMSQPKSTRDGARRMMDQAIVERKHREGGNAPDPQPNSPGSGTTEVIRRSGTSPTPPPPPPPPRPSDFGGRNDPPPPSRPARVEAGGPAVNKTNGQGVDVISIDHNTGMAKVRNRDGSTSNKPLAQLAPYEPPPSGLALLPPPPPPSSSVRGSVTPSQAAAPPKHRDPQQSALERHGPNVNVQSNR